MTKGIKQAVWREEFKWRKPPLGSRWEMMQTGGFWAGTANRQVRRGEIAVVVGHDANVLDDCDEDPTPTRDHCVVIQLEKDGKRTSWGPGWFHHDKAAWRAVKGQDDIINLWLVTEAIKEAANANDS